MKTPDGRVVWQASEFAGPHNSDNKVGHTYDEYAKDPELLRQVFVTGSDIASHLLAENLMGREKQTQNIPGTQRGRGPERVHATKKKGSRGSPSRWSNAAWIRRR
jgi:hypothetical protein